MAGRKVVLIGFFASPSLKTTTRALGFGGILEKVPGITLAGLMNRKAILGIACFWLFSFVIYYFISFSFLRFFLFTEDSIMKSIPSVNQSSERSILVNEIIPVILKFNHKDF